jgi:hypothetical protein
MDMQQVHAAWTCGKYNVFSQNYEKVKISIILMRIVHVRYHNDGSKELNACI